MIGKSKPVSREELAAHIQQGKAQKWLENIAQHKRAIVDGPHLSVSWSGDTCDQIIELMRLRELLTRAEPLHPVDRGNLAQVVHHAISERLKDAPGTKAESVRDPWVALDYALRKWLLGKGGSLRAREDVARRWNMSTSNVSRIWTDHDKESLRRLREMRSAARKRGGTIDQQVDYMLELASKWPAMVANTERMIEEYAGLFMPGVNLRETLSKF